MTKKKTKEKRYIHCIVVVLFNFRMNKTLGMRFEEQRKIKNKK